ncbi:Hpt domain-containing protein [Plantibacter sp. PA-3-X8]|uniref:Hpt domain-containing protein n=1 Tax=Plantibacter sp. PA-3-X8 TaxID=2480625 RepID=UPI000F5DCADB|nr:Hpt domain-containing protein [Plantibacter sp. PA-3-X8]AZH84232.1 Hpt domain-containing protein [Plantibacter sp. PA-3-X8]
MTSPDPGTVDADELRRLLRELSGDLRSRRRFVQTYVEMWPTRLARLGAALDADDTDESKVVLLSIRSSSVMLGVIGVAGLASAGLQAIELGRLERAREIHASLQEVGRRSCERLLELDAADAAES